MSLKTVSAYHHVTNKTSEQRHHFGPEFSLESLYLFVKTHALWNKGLSADTFKDIYNPRQKVLFCPHEPLVRLQKASY
jgi:hypothetical protein